MSRQLEEYERNGGKGGGSGGFCICASSSFFRSSSISALFCAMVLNVFLFFLGLTLEGLYTVGRVNSAQLPPFNRLPFMPLRSVLSKCKAVLR